MDARPGVTPFYNASALEISSPPGTLLRAQAIRLPTFFRAKAWRVLYATRDYRGLPIASSGMVILSAYSPKNPTSRQIVAWAHPTTGVARKCAPSLRDNASRTILGLNDLISAGYIVTATDYPGLGTAGPIGYLVGKGQANAVIDSVRAARQLPEVGGSSSYALWGYSQGGHAALFGAIESTRYAPELKLVGAAATAPPTDLASLLHSDLGSVEGRILAAMTLGSWSVKYGISLGSLVDPHVAAVVAEVGRSCVDDFGGKLAVLTAQKPLKQNFFNANPFLVKPWSTLLASNSIFAIGNPTPIFIAQGDADQIVTPTVTSTFVKSLCRQGTPVVYLKLAGMGHGSAATASSAAAIKWIGDRFKGRPAPSSC